MNAKVVHRMQNPGFEAITGYRLRRQGQTSLLSSGKTEETYNDMWCHLVSRRAWKGRSSTGARTEPSTTQRPSLTPVPRPFGVRIGMVGAPDLSERPQEQQALQRSEQRMRELSGATEGDLRQRPPVLLTADGVIRLFNPAFAALVGGTAEQNAG